MDYSFTVGKKKKELYSTIFMYFFKNKAEYLYIIDLKNVLHLKNANINVRAVFKMPRCIINNDEIRQN